MHENLVIELEFFFFFLNSLGNYEVGSLKP